MWPTDLDEEDTCDRSLQNLWQLFTGLLQRLCEAFAQLLGPQAKPTDVFKKDDDLPQTSETALLEHYAAGHSWQQVSQVSPRPSTADHDLTGRRTTFTEASCRGSPAGTFEGLTAEPTYHRAATAGYAQAHVASGLPAPGPQQAQAQRGHMQLQHPAQHHKRQSQQWAPYLAALPAGARPHSFNRDGLLQSAEPAQYVSGAEGALHVQEWGTQGFKEPRLSRPLPPEASTHRALRPTQSDMGPVAGAHDQQIAVPGPRDDTLAHMHPVLQYYLDPDLHVLSQAEHPQTDAPDLTELMSPQWTSAHAVNVIEFAELHLGQLIGEGAFGKVYYGHWHNQEVAVKVLTADAAQHAQMAREFEREVRIMSALPPHANVLRLVGACLMPPAVALVTPFCPRGSLYGILHSPEVQLSWAQVAHLCLGAAKGMQHLHSHSCLHRDLKSGNLLVDASWTIRVADFGLSKAMETVATLTGGLGTFQWMAPEILARQRYSQKADCYSFGIVLWECCARQVPFAGMNGIQAALAVMERGLRPAIPPHTPPELAHLISACWAAIPEQRPSFSDIAARLDTLCHTLRHV